MNRHERRTKAAGVAPGLKLVRNERTGRRCPGPLTTFLREFGEGLKRNEMAVPCNGCTACCRDPTLYVRVTEEEAKRLKTHLSSTGEKHLDKKGDGECVYLIDNRCSIYADRPSVCRTFDCRLNLITPINEVHQVLLKEGIMQRRYFAMPTEEDKV